MQVLLLIACGGAAGALTRYGLTQAVEQAGSRGFPLGTLLVNVLGCLFAGMVYAWLQRAGETAEAWQALLLVGFMGAFTTFSAFSLATLQLLERGLALQALVNVLASVTLCLVACWAGIAAMAR